MIKRNTKALFRTLDQFPWYILVQQLAQQPLAMAVAELHRLRYAPGKFYHLMVEQRNARFQAHTHGGAVDLGQNVSGQVAVSRRYGLGPGSDAILDDPTAR